MKACEAIARADELSPNAFSPEQKHRWLEEAEGQIYLEITKPTGKAEDIPRVSDVTELTVPHPYSSLYVDYLVSMYARFCGEVNKYNNYLDEYNRKLDAFAKWYVRTHESTKRSIRIWR